MVIAVIDDLRSWAREVWDWRANDRYQGRAEDPLTRNDSLLQFAPASRGEPAVVSYPCYGARLTIHAVLDVPYRSRNGTVHVVCPVGPQHGGMENYIESVAEQIRRRDPAAAALIMAWPEVEERGPGGEPPTGLSGAHHARVTFDHLDRRAATKSDDGIADEPRYSDPWFDYQEPGDNVTRAVFGSDNPFPTRYAEVEDVLSLNPELLDAVNDIEVDWEADRIQLKRAISVSSSTETPVAGGTSAIQKPSKYTVLLSDADALMWDQVAIALRRDLGWKVDKSEMVRALVALAVQDDDLHRQLRESVLPSAMVTTPKDQTAGALASTERPNKYTVLLSDADALMWDQLAFALRRDLRRKVDKSAMVRALVALAAQDDDLHRQLRDMLKRQLTDW